MMSVKKERKEGRTSAVCYHTEMCEFWDDAHWQFRCFNQGIADKNCHIDFINGIDDSL